MKKCLAIVVLFAIVYMIPSYAESGIYKLQVDEHSFDVKYSFDGEILAMGIDQESESLLIGIIDVQDSVFEIGFSPELLNADDGEFVVLVDGVDTDYTITYDGENPTITFPIEAGSEEVEVIGASVIPEFPLGAITIMGAVTAIVLVFSRIKLPFR